MSSSAVASHGFADLIKVEIIPSLEVASLLPSFGTGVLVELGR